MARVEILAGRERRRSWSDEQKRAIVEEAATGALTISEVARRHDVMPQQIYTWRRQICANASTTMAPAFLPVMMAEGEKATSEHSDTGTKGRIEIRCTNGRVLKVGIGLDAPALRALIRSVEDA